MVAQLRQFLQEHCGSSDNSRSRSLMHCGDGPERLSALHNHYAISQSMVSITFESRFGVGAILEAVSASSFSVHPLLRRSMALTNTCIQLRSHDV